MKKLIFLSSLSVMALFSEGCMPAYISIVPEYSEPVRPLRPSDDHIWIDGDWVWSRQTRSYTRRTGSWEVPHHGRTYTKGSWEKTPRGSHWVQGRWR